MGRAAGLLLGPRALPAPGAPAGGEGARCPPGSFPGLSESGSCPALRRSARPPAARLQLPSPLTGLPREVRGERGGAPRSEAALKLGAVRRSSPVLLVRSGRRVVTESCHLEGKPVIVPSCGLSRVCFLGS